MLTDIQELRAYAISLTRNTDRADDLVQNTFLRAWDKRDRFEPGTNLNAWLFTIMRNAFYSEHRKRAWEVADTDGIHAAKLKGGPEQISKLELRDLGLALDRLPPDQRKSLLLVTVEGLSYEEAAVITGVAVGTVKSRVNRARVRLAGLMSATSEDFESDPVIQAALAR
jgi:RNA polymerase sigma-70 factor (ECF subfamily)